MAKLLRLGTEVPADVVLQRAREAGLTKIMVLGLTVDDTPYTDINFTNGSDAIWLLRRTEHAIMRRADELEEG